MNNLHIPLTIFCLLQVLASARQIPLAKADEITETRRLSSNFCSAPVAKAKVVFPESIIGRAKQDFESYSGYVNISTAPDYLFYWFVSAREGSATAPLVIWTNGGPGCTSMEGATTETGPFSLFDIKESCSSAKGQCDYTGQLSTNAYSWNAHANVLYLDQPKNVGYSFGYGAETKSSVEAAADFITFYQEWLTLFPEFVGRELIIAGESYGGHYIPAWADAILNFNKGLSSDVQPINFAGVAIGNGCINNTVQDTAKFVEFQHEANLIPVDSNPRSEGTARTAMSQYLGYTPNYYDYRIESISCQACYGYNYTAWSYWFLQQEVLEALNVCGDAGQDAFAGAAGGCISMGAFDSHDNFDYSGALGRTLDAGVPVTMYFGKQDTACNYVGGLAVANTLPWANTAAWANLPMGVVDIAGVEAGQGKSLNGLTFLAFEGAGHMVPLDQPAASAYVIQTLLKQVPSNQ
jgi:carboxypeptidase C (cathepsin A)